MKRLNLLLFAKSHLTTHNIEYICELCGYDKLIMASSESTSNGSHAKKNIYM